MTRINLIDLRILLASYSFRRTFSNFLASKQTMNELKKVICSEMFVRKLFCSNVRPIFGLRLICGDRKLPSCDNLPSTPSNPCADLSSTPSNCDDLISAKRDDPPLSLPKNANKSIPYPDEVEKQVNVQIRNELQTSHTYLAMAHHFASANYFIGFAGLWHRFVLPALLFV